MYLPNEKSKPLNRFAVYRQLSTATKKQQAEAKDLIPFFLRLDQLMEIEDVAFGKDPPDFVFKVGGNSVGVELTTVNPAIFPPGGNRRREDFRNWQVETKANAEPVSTFEWGAFTLRESLASLKLQFETKCQKAKNWSPLLSEKWLLLQLSEGSPFVALTGELTAKPGHEDEVRDHQLKVVFEVSAILAEPNPFNYVIIFAGCVFLAFPANGKNPHKLPSPRWDAVARGGKVDDSHLDLTTRLKFVVRRGINGFGKEWASEGQSS